MAEFGYSDRDCKSCHPLFLISIRAILTGPGIAYGGTSKGRVGWWIWVYEVMTLKKHSCCSASMSRLQTLICVCCLITMLIRPP